MAKSKKNKHNKPKRTRPTRAKAKHEIERKLVPAGYEQGICVTDKIDLEAFNEYAAVLTAIFEAAVADTDHFQSQDHRSDLSLTPEDLEDWTKHAGKNGQTKVRWLFFNQELKGVNENGRAQAEMRVSENISGNYKLTGKFSKSGKTKDRLEDEVELSTFGTTYDEFEDRELAKKLEETLGDPDYLVPLIAIAGQSQRMWYHPEGYQDVRMELKLDIQIAESYDGKRSPILLLEIEYKGPPDLSRAEINELVDAERDYLLNKYKGRLKEIQSSKSRPLLRHLYQRRESDSKAFARDMADLPDDWYQSRHKKVLEPA